MTSDGLKLESGLWIDEADALDQIEEKLQSGEIDPPTAELLSEFHRDGFTSLTLDMDDAIAATASSYDTLWNKRPHDLLYAYDGPPKRMSQADEERERKHRYRIHDVHSHLPAALELYLAPDLHRLVEEILGEPVVAIQSLLFEYGSQQVLHRDPVVVPTGAPLHLVAAWIALEDINPGSGALAYVPGSHRLPYYEFRPGEYMFDASTMGEKEITEAMAWFDRQIESNGLTQRLFTPRRGDALVWHASLHHGGGPITDASLTRKSLVVHYSTAATYPTRSITVAEPSRDGEKMVVLETDRLLERNGYRGFANPASPDRP